jgi:hypothetical protein
MVKLSSQFSSLRERFGSKDNNIQARSRSQNSSLNENLKEEIESRMANYN